MAGYSYNRRTFIKQGLAASAALMLSGLPLKLSAKEKELVLCVLHSNDWHSRIDPFPMDGSKLQGLGGVVRRAALIEKIKKEQPQVLLLDSGDMLSGTPYFNLYKGEPEFRLMSKMGYDAVTLGISDFENGCESLEQVMKFADFKFVNCNYDFSATVLAGKVQEYIIVQKGKLKVGITGVGSDPGKSEYAHLTSKIVYKDPVASVNALMAVLKKECDYIIVLSHLGYSYDDDTISDRKLAALTENVDLILGGKTHTFMEQAVVVKNRLAKDVIINQAGWGGAMLGRLDIKFGGRSKGGVEYGNFLIQN